MRLLKCLGSAWLLVFSACVSYGQQIGLNFNHNPEHIDFRYVQKVQPDWLRTTPRILDYVDGRLSVQNNQGLEKIVRAGKMGYRIVFGFRWDFKERRLRLPKPGSEREAKYFMMVDSMLTKVGPYVQIFTLGNEPNLETMKEDLQYDNTNQVPLVVFTERLMGRVIDFYNNQKGWQLPKLYVGSFPALFEKAQQKTPGVFEMIQMANESPAIEGLAIHLHIADTLEIPAAFKFVRQLMPTKPIIVPEFSLFRRYNKHLADSIGSSTEGAAYLTACGLPAGLKVYQWLTKFNNGEIPYDQWEKMYATQSWYIPHYFNTYYRYFQQYGVVLATYPLLQQGFRRRVTPKTPSWFLNPLFLQKSLGMDAGGNYYKNPLVYRDFIECMQQGRQRNEAAGSTDLESIPQL